MVELAAMTPTDIDTMTDIELSEAVAREVLGWTTLEMPGRHWLGWTD